MKSDITLTLYKEKYRNELQNFSLPEPQKWFTATPSEAIDSLCDPQRHLVLILSGDTCVGYFVLHEKKGPRSLGFDASALLIRSLAVNSAEQRKGYAYKGMRLLPHFASLHFPWVRKLVLIVNAQNIPAQKLYQKAGFTEYSRRCHEVYGDQYVYLYNIE